MCVFSVVGILSTIVDLETYRHKKTAAIVKLYVIYYI